MRHLLPALLLAPLAACFEPVEPDVDPADLRSGAWQLHLSDLQASGDCATIAVVDSGPVDAVAWLEVDGDRVTMELEGFLLEGRIEGTYLELSGSMGWSDGWDDDIGHPEPMPDDSWDSDDDEGGEDDGEDDGDSDDGDDVEEHDGGAVILPACIDPDPEPSGEELRVSIDADILADDLIRGELTVRLHSADGDCAFESAMVGVAADGGGGWGSGPEPVEPLTEPSEGSSEAGSEGDPGEPLGD